MEKRKVVEVVANVQISAISPLVDDRGFVRFVIQSTGGGVNVGRMLLVFDHRPATVQAARAFSLETSLEKCPLAQIELVKVVNQPAKVVVMERFYGEKAFPYVNLYPANNSKPTVLLSETSYIGKHNAGFSIREGDALWSWVSESSSRTGAHQELTLVALTDENYRVVVESYGYANGGENFTVICAEIRRITETEFVLEFEPTYNPNSRSVVGNVVGYVDP